MTCGNAPLVSVIIPAYNAADTISRAIESVHNQTFADYELIVVDDGSQDATAQIVAERYPNVRLIRQANAGHGAARHPAADMARGEFLAFLDADDEWMPTMLERQVATFTDHPGIDVLLALFRPTDALGGVRQLTFAECMSSYAEGGGYMSWTTFAMKTSTWNAVGGASKHLRAAVDYEFILRCLAHGHSVWILREHLAIHHVLQDSVSYSLKGRLLIARLALEIIRRYDPSQVPRTRDADMLAPAEYEAALKHQLYGSATMIGVWEGNSEEASQLFAEARGLRSPDWKTNILVWAASTGLYLPIRRLLAKLGATARK